MNTPPAVIVRHLQNPTESEIDKIVSVLQAAFDGDLLTRFLVGGDTSLLRSKFEANVRAAVIGGTIYVAATSSNAEDIIGASIWFGPGQGSLMTKEQRAAGWDQFLETAPEELQQWWLDYFIPLMAQMSDLSLGPGFKLQQWHLLLFGVTPEHHQKGYGRAMITTVEKLAKADGVSIVLETPTDLDVKIYKRLGFNVMGQTVVTSPLGKTPMYQMMKTP
ncbi:hypothetical protein BDZ94DRAFT_1197671 [Collybia nuda]|uniref:N-acetyltransferase domain-containing protein n=1 Tax=Collybia nuda TaxID=64659 RepID=A0A9P5Y319_9AGAR|nr:hypothetical protein BDZ94DRAFT_1197671 [Collybia nuda]